MSANLTIDTHYSILSVYSDVINTEGATPYDAAPSVE